MRRRDRVTLGLLGFFIAVAFTMELYWLLHTPAELIAVRSRNVFAHLFDVYAISDRAYFEDRTPFAICLEGVNVYFTQALNLWLMWAIVKRRSYRYPLQLAVASYLTYSVVLYFLVNHVSGYALARERSGYSLFVFYAANAPWLIGHGWMVWDAARAINRRFQNASVEASRGSEWADVNEVRPAS